MKLNDVFPTRYVKAGDLQGKDVALTIRSVTLEEVQHGTEKDQVLAIWFFKTDKGFIVNRTNANIIGKLHSDETDNWVNKRVTLYPTSVRAFGQVHEVIRVRETVPPPPAKKPDAAPAAEVHEINGPEDYLDNDGSDDGSDEAVAPGINPFLDNRVPFWKEVLGMMAQRQLDLVHWASALHLRSKEPCSLEVYTEVRELLKPLAGGTTFTDLLSILCQADIDQDNRPGVQLTNSLIKYAPDVIPLADGRSTPNKEYNPELVAAIRSVANGEVTFEKPEPEKETA